MNYHSIFSILRGAARLPLALLALFIVIVLAGCSDAAAGASITTRAAGASDALGAVNGDAAPDLPFRAPNIQGIERGSSNVDAPAIRTLDEALACLSADEPVFALPTMAGNVRAEAELDGCIMGQVTSGELLRIDGAFAEGSDSALHGSTLLALASDAESDKPALGFVEDIQPIFQRSCANCHGNLVQTIEMNVTTYAGLLAGSARGPVLVPGDADASKLWTQIESGAMPLVGELPEEEKALIEQWINAGAPRQRPTTTTNSGRFWMDVDADSYVQAPNQCADTVDDPQSLISSVLVEPISCGMPPSERQLTALRTELGFIAAQPPGADGTVSNSSASVNGADVEGAEVSDTAADGVADPEALAIDADKPAVDVPLPAAVGLASGTGIDVHALGLPAPSDDDPWLRSRGGFCVDQRRPRNERSITAMAFAPDGRLFLALDSSPTGETDRNVLYDANHPSRSIVVYDSNGDSGWNEILSESSRITGLDWEGGALYLNRAGEVGRIPDGGSYERLAAGFAVQSQLFHANNGIVVRDGWVYVSAGGVRDGYSDGIIDPMPESAALNIVAGGNPYAARVVRAPLEQLLRDRSIGAFQTLGRGFRNPYGLASDPLGRLWVTDNGATNTPEGLSAGDEVNLLNPASVPATGDESVTPFYGFPLVLNGSKPDWYTYPVVDLENTGAPTGITWAYNTIFFAQYGRNPGLYRLGRVGGQIVAERVMLVWPLLSMATAPDGALWIGTGTGGLYRITQGC